ncbi:MAG TPA: acetoacetate--CoA ligase [Gaiellaceae bacterium]|nr:acetoacetate--CoA ligase [Gaiellaceae bacterium]
MERPASDDSGVLWTPPPDVRATTEVGRYLAWLERERGLAFGRYEDLWRWSVDDLAGFWSSIWEFFAVKAHAPYTTALASDAMPGAAWFPGARLNFAEHLIGSDDDPDAIAIVSRSQTRDPVELSFADLRRQVARARAGLARLGVGPGDRVVAYLPNIPETLVAFAATASLGAVWASCAPELGPRSVVDRLVQLEPTVLLTVGGYGFRDRSVDRRAEVATIRDALPTLRHVVHVPYGEHVVPDTLGWDDLLAETGPLEFLPVAFDHPLFVLFSSGTTGRPKAIVHGHGGILLENLKAHSFSWDLKPGGRLLWFSTTSWMMWNALVAALLVRSSIVMLDGDPMWPDAGWQWQVAEETRPSFMGVSPSFLMACRKLGLHPGREYDLGSIRVFGTAGSPLPAEGYRYVYDELGPDVLLVNGSGGTDVCSGIVGGSPLLPVYEGEISGRLLGVATDAFDRRGEPLVGELGELVITRPMPSMPVRLWGDDDGSLYRSSYFDMFPGVWRQGDWIMFSERGSCVVTGRSDATLNRGGVRLGTSEFYSVVEELPEIVDSLVVHLEDDEGGAGELVLFVVLADGVSLDDDLRGRIGRALRAELSPRHVPDTIRAVPAIPRTLTGKKLEAPVKRILRGDPVEAVASRDSLLDPTALDLFASIALNHQSVQEAT